MTFRRTRCAHCKGKLDMSTPNAGLHQECESAWVQSAVQKIERASAKRAKAVKKAEAVQTRERRAALKTIADLIADAQTAFNAFIRERDKDKGCFVCGRRFEPVQGKRQHAGHVRSRGAAGHLRFNEDNCMGECEGCNGPHGAKPHQIKAGAIARIGLEKFEALENDNTPRKWQRDELIAIRATYIQKLKDLKKETA